MTDCMSSGSIDISCTDLADGYIDIFRVNSHQKVPKEILRKPPHTKEEHNGNRLSLWPVHVDPDKG